MIGVSEWHIGHTATLFLSMCTGILCLPHHWIILDNDVRYDDLKRLNVTCDDLHSCQMRNSSVDDLRFFNCDCGPTCMLLGTCCVDSKYRVHEAAFDTSALSCRYINGHSVLETGRCRSNWDEDDFVRDLCLGSAVDLDDPLLMVPVSSSRTGITYRNFFCFVCNVDVDADWPVFWNIKLTSKSNNVSGYSLPDLSFDEGIGSWTIRGSNSSFDIEFEVPDGLESLVRWCRAGYTIKTCADNWTDVVTKQACDAYMAEIAITKEWGLADRYQNPHCAVCNFEDLSDSLCEIEEASLSTKYGVPVGIPGTLFVGLFSMETKRTRCSRNMMLDNIKKTCRAFRCGKGSVNVDGKCEVKRV